MNNAKKNAGISLVALVITIIVLIILTAAVIIVGINTPENNEYAVKMHNKATLQDAVTLYVMTEMLNNIDNFVVTSTGATKARDVADVIKDLYENGTWKQGAEIKLGVSMTLDELNTVFELDDQAVVTFAAGQEPTLDGTEGGNNNNQSSSNSNQQGGNDNNQSGGNRIINLVKNNMMANKVWKYDATTADGTTFATTTDWYSLPELVSVSTGEVIVLHNWGYRADGKQLLYSYKYNASTGKYEDKGRINFGNLYLAYNKNNDTFSYVVPDGITHIGISAKWDTQYPNNGDTYIEIISSEPVIAKEVDLWIFMGQSNMAGRGVTSTTHTEGVPSFVPGAGCEYKAISSPNRLYHISEPFGKRENKTGGINDGDSKTGSLVTAFVNSYYQNTNTPIVAVSASKGGSAISLWQPEGEFLTDTIQRLKGATSYLLSNGYTIRHTYMMWCQGESDAVNGTSKEDYVSMFNNMLNEMMYNGVEDCFLVTIGKRNRAGEYELYDNMVLWQLEMAETMDHVILASQRFTEMRDRGLMKDQSHYYQQAYNEVGTEAGINAAQYVNAQSAN